MRFVFCHILHSVFRNDDRIRMAEAADTGDIDSGFNGKNHILLQDDLRIVAQIRLFMSSQALPVSDAVDCIVAVAILAQHIASRLVKLRRADTRTHHVEHRLLCFDHGTERALGIFFQARHGIH